MAQCEQTKTNGARCGGYAVSGSSYCFFHDPASAEKREAAQEKGGRAGTGARLPEATDSIQTISDVINLMEATINDVRAGRIDPKVSNAVGYLANISIKALALREIEERLEAIEGVLEPERARELSTWRRA